jgi:hypothetical protein
MFNAEGHLSSEVAVHHVDWSRIEMTCNIVLGLSIGPARPPIKVDLLLPLYDKDYDIVIVDVWLWYNLLTIVC